MKGYVLIRSILAKSSLGTNTEEQNISILYQDRRLHHKYSCGTKGK